jgi:hypothetical protein
MYNVCMFKCSEYVQCILAALVTREGREGINTCLMTTAFGRYLSYSNTIVMSLSEQAFERGGYRILPILRSGRALTVSMSRHSVAQRRTTLGHKVSLIFSVL